MTDGSERPPWDWAVDKWHDEVANRPLQNIHRRTLDDTWRQVIRHYGGEDVDLVGPRHDDLVAALQTKPLGLKYIGIIQDKPVID